MASYFTLCLCSENPESAKTETQFPSTGPQTVTNRDRISLFQKHHFEKLRGRALGCRSERKSAAWVSFRAAGARRALALRDCTGSGASARRDNISAVPAPFPTGRRPQPFSPLQLEPGGGGAPGLPHPSGSLLGYFSHGGRGANIANELQLWGPWRRDPTAVTGGGVRGKAGSRR